MHCIKDLTVLNLDPKLIEMVEWLFELIGPQLITSAYRPGDDGVHGVFRGLDLRCRTKSVGDAICNFVNSHWMYDPERPDRKCCLCHTVGRGLHLHLQVHPNTKRL